MVGRCWREGLVHRDVKPSNVILDERFEPLLMDFGIVKDLRAATPLSLDGAMIGTPLLERMPALREPVEALAARLKQIEGER